jgi:hypothetical protein
MRTLSITPFLTEIAAATLTSGSPSIPVGDLSK